MKEITYPKLSDYIRRLRWQAPLLALLLVLVHQLVEHTWLVGLPRWQHFATQTLFYGLIGPILAWWALTSLLRSVRETEKAQQALHEVNQRLEFLFQVNRRLAEAEDEEALIDVILALPLEVVSAVGCSLIRFDERGQPLPAFHRGNLEPAVFEQWAAHLSTVEVRQGCQHCSTHRATTASPCSLLRSFPGTMIVGQVYCLVLERNGREYGVLNIYLAEADPLQEREQTLLTAMANEMSLVLESHYLRSRELTTLYHLQQVRRLSNLQEALTEVLTHTVKILETDGGALFLTNTETADLDLFAEVGQPLNTTLSLVKGVVDGTRQSEVPLIISDLKQEGENNESLRSLLVAPLRNEGRSLGGLVLWAAHADAFSSRRIQLLATLAGQMALLLENQQLYMQAEYQAVLGERARLAREIHDGLAQTLGYLKLRTAQIATWLQKDEIERAKAALGEIRALLGEAYVDAREAIDGLRLKPDQGKLADWLDQALTDFQSLSNIQVEAPPPPEIVFQPEIQMQLLRIVQESLSNIRKHSAATYAQLEWQSDACRLTLRIMDNGQGFDPADVSPISQHGLRIMRERAELLDADFQIISKPGQGTQVVVRLPVSQTRQVEDHGRVD